MLGTQWENELLLQLWKYWLTHEVLAHENEWHGHSAWFLWSVILPARMSEKERILENFWATQIKSDEEVSHRQVESTDACSVYKVTWKWGRKRSQAYGHTRSQAGSDTSSSLPLTSPATERLGLFLHSLSYMLVNSAMFVSSSTDNTLGIQWWPS